MRNWFRSHSSYLLGAVLCSAVLLFPDLAAAAGEQNTALKGFASIVSSLVHIGTAIALIIINFMPAVWGADLITGPAVTEGITPLWIYVRNLANIAFVGMILVVAAVNLATAGGNGSWSIKAKLGPIILGLVAINFSMLVVRTLVDAVNVGTVALLSIADPVLTERGVDTLADYYEIKVHSDTFDVCAKDDASEKCQPIRDVINTSFCKSEENCLFKVLPRDKMDLSKLENPAKKNIMLAFGFFFMHLESLPQLSADTGSLFSVVDSVIFSLVMGVAFLIAILAIFIVLLIRVVMMWLFIIFSPILVMGWVFGFQIPVLSDQFWKYLLVPVKVAGALAFSMVMLAALQGMTVPPEVYTTVIEPGPAMKKFWGPEEFGGFKVIWQILTVILFWKVVFDFALKDLEGLDGIVGGIKNFGSTLGSTALTFAADKIPIPSISANGESRTLAQALPGGALNPVTGLARLRNSMRLGQESGSAADEERFKNQFRGAAGAALTADDIRKIINSGDRKLLLDSYQNGSATDKKLISEILLKGDRSGGYTERMTRAELETALERSAVYQKTTTPPAADVVPPVTELKSAAKIEGTITVKNETGADTDISLSEVASGTTLTADVLKSSGLTQAVLRDLKLNTVAESVRAKAGLEASRTTEILDILQAIRDE